MILVIQCSSHQEEKTITTSIKSKLSIQDRIDEAKDEDTIIIKPGIYFAKIIY